MQYDFDRVVDRKSTYDMKWNKALVEANLHAAVKDDFVPMWLADTDFACAPHIVKAVQARADKEIYGYCAPLPPFYTAIQYWESKRFGWEVGKEAITALPSVVAGINIAIRAFSSEGDGVIIQPPVYDPFSAIVKRTKRKVISNTLRCVDGHYEMDFDLLAAQAAEPQNKVMILCSPHNPVGRVWTKDELRRVADICIANDVILVSDEIHSDIVYGGNTHYPLLSLSEEYSQHFVHLTAPSKTFNIPGLKMSVAIIPNAQLKQSFDEMQLALSLDVRNTFGFEGIIAAYSQQSLPWLSEELAYLQGNIDYVVSYVEEHLPKIKLQRPEGTFLCWLDCTELGLSEAQLMKKVNIDAGVVCIPGTWFGECGAQHLRLNVGCTRATLQLAMQKIASVLKT